MRGKNKMMPKGRKAKAPKARNVAKGGRRGFNNVARPKSKALKR